MPEHDSGRLAASAAEVYDSFFVPALFGRFSPAIAVRAPVSGADDVVDVACGTGALTRELRARTSGRVVGTDVNPAMLDVAARAANEIEYLEADALDLPFEAGEFDVATCQFGLMFFADPSAGVSEMRRVASKGAVAVWDSVETSEGYSALKRLLGRELGAGAAASLDAPFGLGADGVLEGILEAGGARGATIDSIAGSARFADVREWVTTEVRGWTLGESVSDEELAALVSVAEVELGAFAGPEGCVVPMSARMAVWG